MEQSVGGREIVRPHMLLKRASIRVVAYTRISSDDVPLLLQQPRSRWLLVNGVANVFSLLSPTFNRQHVRAVQFLHGRRQGIGQGTVSGTLFDQRRGL